MSIEQQRIEDAVKEFVAKPSNLVVYGTWLACKLIRKTLANLAARMRRCLQMSSARPHRTPVADHLPGLSLEGERPSG